LVGDELFQAILAVTKKVTGVDVDLDRGLQYQQQRLICLAIRTDQGVLEQSCGSQQGGHGSDALRSMADLGQSQPSRLRSGHTSLNPAKQTTLATARAGRQPPLGGATSSP
jgi:hypothetical protein